MPSLEKGERRQLTVMFCDLVESSALSQLLDAEDYREVMHAFQEKCRQTLERYEGYVAQYLGDGVLVYFGYPLAHEVDAERSVRAGLELLQQIKLLNVQLEQSPGVCLAVRVGIHTGLVVVGEMGSGARRETLALGDTTNIAARLEAVADPNSVVISDATLKLVSGLFLTHDLGTPMLKGISEAVRAFQILQPSGVRSRLDVAVRRTPFVGRTQETELLLQRWQEVVDGEGRAVGISGEAGIGKSRLVQNLRERIADQPHTWLECSCSPFATNSAFHPVIELVRQGLGFTEEESPREKLSRLEGGLQLAGLSLEENVPLFAQLLSVPLNNHYPPLKESPEKVRQRTFGAMLGWTLSLAGQQPMVLLCEDLHWSDPSTLELLEQLFKQIVKYQLFCLLTHRPEFKARWPESQPISTIALLRLSREEVRRMAVKASEKKALSDEVLDQIAERTDGIPLFVEELVKMTTERSISGATAISELAVPPTLQDLLMARLDRMGTTKPVAQLAATIGREFSSDLLSKVVRQDDLQLQSALARLVDAEILYRRGSSSEAIYTFKHALIQETAYKSLLRRQRRLFHARIAAVLKKDFPKLVKYQPETLAHHFHQAGELLQAAACFDQAGRRAAEQAAYREALNHYRRGLEVLAGIDSNPERDRQELSLQIMLGNALMAAKGYAAEESLAVWQRGCELAETLNDLEELSSALNGAATFHLVAGDCWSAKLHAERILKLAEESNIRMAALRGHCTMAQALFYLGDADGSLPHAKRAIEIYRPSDFQAVTYGSGSDQGVVAYGMAAITLWWLGWPDQALEQARAGVKLARQLESQLSLAMAQIFEVVTLYLRGKSQQALDTAEQIISLSENLGFPDSLGFGLVLAGVERTRLQNDKEGIEQVLRGIDILGKIGNLAGAPFGLALLAEAQLNAGDLEEALKAVDGALAIAQQMKQPFYDPEILRLKAEIVVAKDHRKQSEAENLLRRALEDARQRKLRSFELRAATSLAHLLKDDNHKDEARIILSEISNSFSEGFDTRDLQRAGVLLNVLS
jgi:class 3 adenylate cyclase/tetratricopeptide (TPR) repeat protein